MDYMKVTDLTEKTQEQISGNELVLVSDLDQTFSAKLTSVIGALGGGGGGGAGLFLGIFDNEIQAAIAAGTLINGHMYYDTSLGDFKIYNGTIWVQRGQSGGNISEFCPNYVPIFINSTTFKIDGFHLSLLFSVGRRLRIIEGSVNKYGVINNVIENGTLPGVIDTTITVTMEGDDVITNQLSNICITSSATNWVPIAANPSAGRAINAIRSGIYGTHSIVVSVSVETGEEQLEIIPGSPVVIAVGDGGLIMRSTDGGATFEQIESGTIKKLNDIAYDYTNEHFMVVGDGGIILFSTDGGLTWAPPQFDPKPLGDLLHCKACSYGSSDGFIVGIRNSTTSDNYRIYQTTDLGTSAWTAPPATLSGTILNQIEFSQSQDYFIATTTTSLNYSTNPDGLWNSIDDGIAFNNTCCCYLNSSLGALAGGINGAISRTADAQANGGWAAVADSSFNLTDVLSIDAADSSDLIHPMVVAVGRAGKIGYSMDNGVTWTQTPNGFSPTDDINVVHFDSYNKVFIAGSANGVICRSTNGIT